MELNLQSLTLDTDYRRLLKEQPADDSNSSTDQDDLVEEPASIDAADSINLDVVGVSISHAQTYMKSPDTPAIEKTRALDESKDYFNDSPKLASIGEDADVVASMPLGDESSHSKSSTPPAVSSSSPGDSPQQQTRRSSMIRSILGESDGNRKRSLSGPTMLGNIKKILPDLPSVPGFKTPTTPVSEQMSASKGSECNERQPKLPPISPLSPISRVSTRRETVAVPRSPLGLDGNVESLLTPTSPRSLARSNSDASLYLKRRPTQASAFDDTSAFADITEMHNSRFKAITDSFQNSTLRLPRLPNIKYTIRKDDELPASSVDDLTASNTRGNTGGGQGASQYYPTNFYNIRSPKKSVEADSAQQRAHPVLSDALAKTTGDLVIMGGYRGSILRDAKPPHRQLWAPVKVGLNLRNVDLEVGLTRKDEESAYKKVYSSGILSHIGPIDISRRLLKHARKCPNTRRGDLRIHDWGYDWRLSPDLLGQRLIKFLESLECNRPGTPPEKRGATIIAHSLGGLLTRWAVNRRPELFAGVVYAGAPQNCVNILGPLRHGDDVLLSSKVLTAQVNFTMRTSFALLPENGRCFINKHTNERYDLDFFDPQTWDDFHLSPCINLAVPPVMKEHRKSIIGSISDSITSSLPSMPSVPVPGKRASWFGGNPEQNEASNTPDQSNAGATPAQGLALRTVESSMEPNMKSSSSNSTKSSIATACTIPLPQAKEYLSRTLAEIKDFKLALAHDAALQRSNRYPPNAIIFGKTVPTVYGARVLSRDHIKYTDAFDDLAFAAGDGVVLASAAQLPDGYRCVKGGRVESDRGHVGLLGDLEGVGRCLAAIVEARGKGVGMGCYSK